MHVFVHVGVCLVAYHLVVCRPVPSLQTQCVCLCVSLCCALPLSLFLYPEMMRNPSVLALAVLLMACISAVQGSSHAMHAGSMIVPEFDEVIVIVFVCACDTVRFNCVYACTYSFMYV